MKPGNRFSNFITLIGFALHKREREERDRVSISRAGQADDVRTARGAVIDHDSSRPGPRDGRSEFNADFAACFHRERCAARGCLREVSADGNAADVQGRVTSITEDGSLWRT